jgi:hypothetical protein
VIAYWILFIIFASGALLEHDAEGPRRRSALMLIGALLIALMIGLRFKVGADWLAYQVIFNYSKLLDAARSIRAFGDPAYSLLTWSVSHLGGSIWQVNLVCGLIFSWGLLRFARTQANPWLAMTVAIPYLVVVVAMGYSRQGVAIGILLAGLASVLNGGSTLRFASYVAAAALFHKTAVVVLPLVALSQPRSRIINILAGIALTVLFYDFFLSQSMNVLYRNYIKAEYSSQGAGIRIALNVVPSLLYLINRRNFGFTNIESKLWLIFSMASFAFFALFLISPSSTAVDRMGLYVMPIQIAIWSRVHMAYRLGRFGRVLIVALSALILFTWLNFAIFSKAWLPYQFYPLFS